MVKEESNVVWLNELCRDDRMIAGGKCCHLGEMSRAGMPVPPGFALTLHAYDSFLEESGAKEAIEKIMEKHKQEMLSNMGKAEEVSSYIINEVILQKEMPESLKEEIAAFYEELGNRCSLTDVSVAVRSSGPVSMPGQFDTFLNVSGYEDLLNHIIKVWASSFNARAMAYRAQRDMPVDSSPIGVAVLKMVNARCSGVMFTLDPVNGDPSRIFIEGSWGLGESLVSGQVTPDKFVLDKVTLDITKKNICAKVIELVRGPDGDVVPKDIPPEKQSIPCLSDEEILALAHIGKKIEKHYGVAQDIEWGLDNDLSFPDNVLILQTRQESIWTKKTREPVGKRGNATEMIAKGLMQGIRL